MVHMQEMSRGKETERTGSENEHRCPQYYNMTPLKLPEQYAYNNNNDKMITVVLIITTFQLNCFFYKVAR